MVLFKKRRRVNQFQNQVISLRNEELASSWLGAKADIMAIILTENGTIENAVREGYSHEAILNAVKVLEENGFTVDFKKRRITIA